MDWGNYLFGFHGRINRAKMWLYILIAFGAEIVFASLCWALIGAAMIGIIMGTAAPGAALFSGASGVLAALLIIVFLVLAVWTGLAVAVKRLHDRAKSAWWLIVFYVVPAVFNVIAAGTASGGMEGRSHMSTTGAVFSLVALAITVWAFIELYCLRGTTGENPYGPDPLASHITTAAAA